MYLHSSLVDIKPEILDALMTKQPVVALESTIITHGMPHPHNLETAISVEKIVREQGAFPATIAILKGRIKIGLTENELAELADPNTKTVKTSRRDFAYVLGQHLNGGTTVAGTIICSELCGIKIFATGGIGGVHRNGETTMDISADLVEMGRSSVAVISSGIKSILDIPRTMEYLETQGVFVSTYQVTDKEFPAFYTRKSGVKAPYNFVDAEDAAKCIRRSHQLGLKSGILIGVPVPDQHAMDESVISKSISNALKEAEHVGIHGKDVTPFILAAISEITAGKSLQTNINLIKNNAKVAAQIAVALGEKPTAFDSDVDSNFPRINNLDNLIPVIVGGSIMDIHYRVLTENLQV
ncbi:CLUMA_CG012023, isoform A, partial [Clunio marinus]